MMRKYGLDETQVYVEQSTLLEPNNFIPSWVSYKENLSIPYEFKFTRMKIKDDIGSWW